MILGRDISIALGADLKQYYHIINGGYGLFKGSKYQWLIWIF